MPRNKKRQKHLPRKRVLLTAAVLYLSGSVFYYFLPWETRKPVYTAVPWADRLMCRSGWTLVRTWDELGIGGKDCSVAAAENRTSGCDACGGLPDGGTGRLLENKGYVLCYSETLRVPLWAAYRVFDVPSLRASKRPGFMRDRRSAAGVSPEDYTGSGYDRGHLAPNYAVATRYGPVAQRETFLMTNVMPQTPNVNRHLWKDIELRIAKEYGRYFGEVWVIAGPVFKEPVSRLPSGIAIPYAYYQIVTDFDRGNLRVMAFLVSKDTPPYTRPRRCLVSVDRLEELTGLDFFPGLPVELQEELEKEPAGRLWPWLIPAIRYHLTGATR
jgi:DNA/RNA endonuclease G (NUC1)